jgi:hypothetical protein
MARNARQSLTSADRVHFAPGSRVRYKPGIGTYGYEDLVEEPDGRIPAHVLGFTVSRIRIEFYRGRSPIRRAVEKGSLVLVQLGPEETSGTARS